MTTHSEQIKKFCTVCFFFQVLLAVTEGVNGVLEAVILIPQILQYNSPENGMLSIKFFAGKSCVSIIKTRKCLFIENPHGIFKYTLPFVNILYRYNSNY